MRSLYDYLILLLKGAGMGVADVVPGVSGGTIAFISGIYEELVTSLKSINLRALQLLIKGKIGEFIKTINGLFLLAVFGGVAISIFSLAKVMKWLLLNHPVIVWSFFFGLILSSSVYVLKAAGRLRVPEWSAFIIGIATAWIITTVSPATTPEIWWFIILSGAIGICAMILPGISGAFILLLLGKYLFIITAVSELNIPVILLFVAGAVTGLILFSNLLGWLLKNYHSVTIALLAGFMIGSLRKVWPWKIPTEFIENTHGELIVISEKNVLPGRFLTEGSGDPMLVAAIAVFFTGIIVMVVLQRAGRREVE